MQVAKLSTGGVVLYLKPPQDVQFAVLWADPKDLKPELLRPFTSLEN